MTALVHDLNHNNPINVGAAARGGIVALIHKATEGVTFVDREYAKRRQLARSAGLEWGAYHFCSGEAVHLQVEHFLETADPDDRSVMVLDFEDNNKSQMSFRQMIDFLGYADQKLGRPVDIYSGNRIKDTICVAHAADREFLAKRRLWLCEYGPRAKLVDANGHPLPWQKYWLWQCWADGLGPKPIPTVPGLEAKADLSIFDGTADELRATWVPATTPLPTVRAPPLVANAPIATPPPKSWLASLASFFAPSRGA